MSGTTFERFYPIGTPGQSWTSEDKIAWRDNQTEIKRSYAEEVLAKINEFKSNPEYEVSQYGALSYDVERYPLFCVKTTNWSSDKPTILVTGGVHGYESMSHKLSLSLSLLLSLSLCLCLSLYV